MGVRTPRRRILAALLAASAVLSACAPWRHMRTTDAEKRIVYHQLTERLATIQLLRVRRWGG